MIFKKKVEKVEEEKNFLFNIIVLATDRLIKALQLM